MLILRDCELIREQFENLLYILISFFECQE